MPLITDNARYLYGLHGWSEADIDYLEENAHDIIEQNGWVMGVGIASDGTVWLYPTSKGNVFPLSLWKEIKWFIEHHDSVVIPMDRNMDRVSNAAKRWNGYLVDNLWLFGDELKGIQTINRKKMSSHFKGENNG